MRGDNVSIIIFRILPGYGAGTRGKVKNLKDIFKVSFLRVTRKN
jgi:hypothetical protein